MIIEKDYFATIGMVEHIGLTSFIEQLEEEYQLELFKCSTAWLSDRTFGCKVKGVKGDLLIQWAIGEPDECPRCFEKLADGGIASRNSICRIDNETILCNDCGTEQAFKEWRV